MTALHQLGNYLPSGDYDFVNVSEGFAFNDLVDDSREVKADDLFVLRERDPVRGLMFAEQAIKSGASGVLTGCAIGADLPQIVVDDLDGAADRIANLLYAHHKQISLVGITGTDGKTSVAMMLAQAISAIDGDCGISGTINIGSIQRPESARLTTPSNIAIKRWLSHLVGEACGHAVMEVSSHALAQHRVKDLQFSVAALTNLGRDHLDYHHDLSHYYAAKATLFTDYSPAAVVYFADDLQSAELLASVPESVKWPIGRQVSGKKALSVEAHEYNQGLSMRLQGDGDEYEVHLPLVGDFQYKNVAMTLQIMRVLGFDAAQIRQGLQAIRSIPGRMELVVHDSPSPMVVVDYSHTDQAIANALMALRPVAVARGGQVRIIFGCGGDRDPGKRPVMAQAAEQGADRVYLTSDNPRTEAPEKIIAEARAGFANPDQHVCEIDRRQAIVAAIREASEHDVVLIAGKGHETYQEINEKRYPFSDSVEALAALKEFWK